MDMNSLANRLSKVIGSIESKLGIEIPERIKRQGDWKLRFLFMIEEIDKYIGPPEDGSNKMEELLEVLGNTPGYGESSIEKLRAVMVENNLL